MSLIKCPECGKEISSTVNNCPHCGYVIKHRNVEKHPIYYGLKTGIFILLVITFATIKYDFTVKIIGISLGHILVFGWLIVIILLFAILLKMKK